MKRLSDVASVGESERKGLALHWLHTQAHADSSPCVPQIETTGARPLWLDWIPVRASPSSRQAKRSHIAEAIQILWFELGLDKLARQGTLQAVHNGVQDSDPKRPRSIRQGLCQMEAEPARDSFAQGQGLPSLV